MSASPRTSRVSSRRPLKPAIPKPRSLLPAVVASLLAASCGDDTEPPPGPDPRLEELGRCAEFNPERNAYFGDLHVHTALSLDANLQGNRLTVADAYRFARGEAVGIQQIGRASCRERV